MSFTWKGAWEFDPVSGTGTARLRKDGRLSGTIKIRNGDESTFLAEKADLYLQKSRRFSPIALFPLDLSHLTSGRRRIHRPDLDGLLEIAG